VIISPLNPITIVIALPLVYIIKVIMLPASGLLESAFLSSSALVHNIGKTINHLFQLLMFQINGDIR